MGRSVVVAGGNDDDLLVRNEVDKAVLVVDATRPSPGQVVFERLRLTDAGEGVPAYVLDEFVDPDKRLAIDPQPGCVVLPALVFEYQPHLSRPRGSAAARSRRAPILAGWPRVVQLSLTAVPEALTISMLFPTVS